MTQEHVRPNPDHCVGILVVQIKRISQKMSWTEHLTGRSAKMEISSCKRNREQGRNPRFLYRVNVYIKRSESLLLMLRDQGRVNYG